MGHLKEYYIIVSSFIILEPILIMTMVEMNIFL